MARLTSMQRGHTVLWLILSVLIAGLAVVVGLRLLGGPQDGVTVEPGRYDFGRVMQGETPTAVLTVTNHSDRVVSLMPQPNCGCFAVEHGKSLSPLDPGASMQVHILFDTSKKAPGPVQGKWITFNTDHPDHRGVVVPLEGEIFRAYELRPDKLNLGRIDGRPRNFEPRVLHLTPMSDYHVRVAKVVSTPEVFDVELRDLPHGAVDIALTLRRGQRRAVGVFRADVRLELELTAPGGVRAEERPVVVVEGFWSIPPDGSDPK